jgi:hypothetical protein
MRRAAPKHLATPALRRGTFVAPSGRGVRERKPIAADQLEEMAEVFFK